MERVNLLTRKIQPGDVCQGDFGRFNIEAELSNPDPNHNKGAASQNTQPYESVKSRTNQARVGYGTYKEDVPYWDSNFSYTVRIATYEVVWSK
jgi:hypothetical protein